MNRMGDGPDLGNPHARRTKKGDRGAETGKRGKGRRRGGEPDGSEREVWNVDEMRVASLPPVGWHRTVLHEAHTTTLAA